MKKVSALILSMAVFVFVAGMVYADDDFMKYQAPGSMCPGGKVIAYSTAINKVEQILNKKYPQYYIDDVDVEYTFYKIEVEKRGVGQDLVFAVDICTGAVNGPYPD